MADAWQHSEAKQGDAGGFGNHPIEAAGVCRIADAEGRSASTLQIANWICACHRPEELIIERWRVGRSPRPPVAIPVLLPSACIGYSDGSVNTAASVSIRIPSASEACP